MLTNDRERRQLANQCGLVQIQVSRGVSARGKLHALWRRSPLGVRELAEVFGVEYMTVRNHLGGRKIARARTDWYHRLEAIDVRPDGTVHLIIRYRPTRKKWGWKLTPAQKAAIFAAVIAAPIVLRPQSK